MTDTLNEIKEQMQGISLVAYEASEERHTREKKNLVICFTCIILALIIALIGSSTLAWILYDKSMETVTETTETIETITYDGVEQNTDGGGNNVIGGDING